MPKGLAVQVEGSVRFQFKELEHWSAEKMKAFLEGVARVVAAPPEG
jgi:hypothetical protein